MKSINFSTSCERFLTYFVLVLVLTKEATLQVFQQRQSICRKTQIVVALFDVRQGTRRVYSEEL